MPGEARGALRQRAEPTVSRGHYRRADVCASPGAPGAWRAHVLLCRRRCDFEQDLNSVTPSPTPSPSPSRRPSAALGARAPQAPAQTSDRGSTAAETQGDARAARSTFVPRFSAARAALTSLRPRDHGALSACLHDSPNPYSPVRRSRPMVREHAAGAGAPLRTRNGPTGRVDGTQVATLTDRRTAYRTLSQATSGSRALRRIPGVCGAQCSACSAAAGRAAEGVRGTKHIHVCAQIMFQREQ